MKKITSLILLMLCSLVGYSQIISTGFETGVPAGWIITNNGNGVNSPWVVNNTASLANTGNSSLMVSPETASVTAPIQDWVITSAVDLTGVINPKLSFYGKITPAGPTRNSKLEVRISTTNTDLASFTSIITFDDFNSNAPNPISPVGGTYGFQELSLLPYSGQTIYVAFVMTNQGQGKTWFLDDISLFEDCPEPTNLGITNVESNSATATWSNPGGAPTFQLEVVLANANPTGIPTYTSTTTTTSHNIVNLQPNNTYKYYIRSVCSNNGNGEWVGPFEFETNALPATLPYTENFEAFHGWRFVNGSQVNKWIVGSATSNGGTKSLYISNNDGVNNIYTITTTSTTQVFRDIVIPAGTNEILFTFDYRGQGQTTSDYMRLWSTPTTFVPTAGTQVNNTNGVLVGDYINQTPEYTNKSYVVNVSAYAGTTRRFVFEWRNNNTTGTQPPASVDNINVKVIACSAPSALVLNSVTAQTANISWTAPTVPPASYDYYYSQTNTPPTDNTVASGTSTTNSATISGLNPGSTYFIWVRSNCGTNGKSFWIGYVIAQTDQIAVPLPYNESFEGAHGFQYSNVNQPNYWTVGTATQNGGTKSLYVTNNGQNNEYTITAASSVAAFKDIMIPAGTAEINVQFDFKGMGQANTDRMRVWLVPTTFIPTAGTNITAGNSGGVQIGLANYNEVPNWTTYNNVVNVAAFAGTNRRIVFEWINNATVGTQPPAAVDNVNINVITCVAPTNLTLTTVGQNDATLSWVAPTTTNIASYDYYYSTVNTPPTAATPPSGTTTNTSVTITGLNASTQYFFWVRSNCGSADGNSFWVGSTSFYTTQIPAELNFFEGFEGETAFTINNTTFPNKWIIGNAISSSGNKSLYVSNNNQDFQYTVSTSTTVVHAYRDIAIPANISTDLAISYDWRNQGEGNNDYLRVWVVPSTLTPVPGTLISAANTGAVQLGGNHQLSNTWKNELHIFSPATYAGQTIRLVFEWRNNTTAGEQSPAAVDNIEVKEITCPAPINLVAVNGLGGALNLTWTPVGNETQWEVVIQNMDAGAPGTNPTTSVIVSGNPTYSFMPQVGQMYEFYVRAICSETDKSFWTGPELFSIFQPDACADLDILPLDLDVNSNGEYIICDGEDVTINLQANFDQDSFKATTSYAIEAIDYNPPFPFLGGTPMPITSDDDYTASFNLPFAFCFFGNQYTYCRVGDNGVVTFGMPYTTTYGDYCPYTLNGPLPSTTFSVKNSIFGVFQDLHTTNNPGPNTQINYQVLGTYPCRALVVNFNEVPAFGGSCNGEQYRMTTQIVLYEITNIIEVYVKKRIACNGWQSGKGVIGLLNSTGTVAYTPPGRNTGNWNAEQEAWRFKPDGVSTPTFGWYQDGVLISTDTQHDVTIDESTHFEAVISFPGCGGDDLVLRKSFNVVVSEEIILPQAGEIVICANDLQNPDRGRINDNDEVILSSLGNPSNFSMTYYHSEVDAKNATNQILDAENYVPATFPEIIFVRVENNETGCYGITSFTVREGEVLEIDLQDKVICTNYTLEALPANQRYVKYEVLNPLNHLLVDETIETPANETILPIGFYRVYIEIESEDGCKETYDHKVSVIPCEIPRGISPNGDGLNDFLDLTYYMASSVKIFNRFGQVVYSHGPGYTNQWHGQSNSGSALPSGTYFYDIVTPYEHFTGWIQLVQEQN